MSPKLQAVIKAPLPGANPSDILLPGAKKTRGNSPLASDTKAAEKNKLNKDAKMLDSRRHCLCGKIF